MQMLGKTLNDPEGLEGTDQRGPQSGLGLLPLETTFSGVSMGQRPSMLRWLSRFVPLKVVSRGRRPKPLWGPR